MATNFPSSLDSFTNPSGTDAMDSVTVPHATQHANLNDAVEALEAKVGVDGSAVTGSLDYKVANQGLVLVKSVAVGSGVSSVTVTNAFSATFDNYEIIMSGGTQTSTTDVKLKLGSSATGYYGFLAYGSVTSSTVNGATRNNATQFNWVGGPSGVGEATHASFQLFAPYLSMYTKIRNAGYQNGNNYGTMQGEHQVASSYTSFELFVDAGLLSGGTIRVYGYNNG